MLSVGVAGDDHSAEVSSRVDSPLRWREAYVLNHRFMIRE
jgi:hypothetical protein